MICKAAVYVCLCVCDLIDIVDAFLKISRFDARLCFICWIGNVICTFFVLMLMIDSDVLFKIKKINENEIIIIVCLFFFWSDIGFFELMLMIVWINIVMLKFFSILFFSSSFFKTSFYIILISEMFRISIMFCICNVNNWNTFIFWKL